MYKITFGCTDQFFFLANFGASRGGGFGKIIIGNHNKFCSGSSKHWLIQGVVLRRSRASLRAHAQDIVNDGGLDQNVDL